MALTGACVALVASGGASAGAGGAARADRAPTAIKNPCLDRETRKKRGLLCPDLRMSVPYDIVRDETASGTPILRAANSINSIGDGPAELHGERSGRYTMNAVNQIHKKSGGKATFKTGAELYFKDVPGQGRYWKFKDAARMELWRLDSSGVRKRLVSVGPKQIYCLRDLAITNPELPNAQPSEFYPGCSQNPNRREVTLGTSVGWSDVYPYTYHEQWIKINKIPARGCYAYVHIADPQNGILELDEENNEASTVVYLTKRSKYIPGRCDGVTDQGLPDEQTGDDDPAPPNGGTGGGGATGGSGGYP